MIGRLRRLQLGLELVRGAVLVVAGARMAVAAAREFLAADKAATVAYLEAQPAADGCTCNASNINSRPEPPEPPFPHLDGCPLYVAEPAPATAGGDDAA